MAWVFLGPWNIGRERGNSIIFISEVPFVSVGIFVVVFVVVIWIVVVVGDTWISNMLGVESNKDLLKLTRHGIELGLHGKWDCLLLVDLLFVPC